MTPECGEKYRLEDGGEMVEVKRVSGLGSGGYVAVEDVETGERSEIDVMMFESIYELVEEEPQE